MIELFSDIIRSQSGVLYVVGKPGIGKSAIMKKIAQINGWQFINLHLTSYDETDLAGIPRAVEYKGETVTKMALPEWAVKANEKPTLIFFDEVNRCREDVMNALLKILHERTVGHNFQFNNHVYMVAAGNIGSFSEVESDGAEVNDFDSAFKGRLVTIKYDPSHKEWIEEFGKENVNRHIINFIQSHPSDFYIYDENRSSYPSPRSWTNLSNFLKSKLGENWEKIPSILKLKIDLIAQAYVGISAVNFIQYLNEISKVSYEDLLNNFDKHKDYVLTLNRSEISGYVHEFKELMLDELTDKQVMNLKKFIKLLEQDEKLALYLELGKNIKDLKRFGKDGLCIYEDRDLKQIATETIYKELNTSNSR